MGINFYSNSIKSLKWYLSVWPINLRFTVIQTQVTSRKYLRLQKYCEMNYNRTFRRQDISTLQCIFNLKAHNSTQIILIPKCGLLRNYLNFGVKHRCAFKVCKNCVLALRWWLVTWLIFNYLLQITIIHNKTRPINCKVPVYQSIAITTQCNSALSSAFFQTNNTI